MIISSEIKNSYVDAVYDEMRKRGFTKEEIPRVISKTGFMEALEEYPEEQLHYDVSDAVEEIIITAARQ